MRYSRRPKDILLGREHFKIRTGKKVHKIFVRTDVRWEGEERGERSGSGSLPYFRRRQIVPHFTPKCPNLAHFIAVEPIVTRRFLKASLLYRNEPRHEIEARRFQPAPGNALKTKRTRAKSKVNELRSQKRVETEIVEIRFRAVKCSVTY